MNTVLAKAVVCSGNEIATLTEHQKALHTAEQKELLNIGKYGVVEVVDIPQSQQVLPTRWVQKQRLDGSHKMRIVARGFELTVSPDADFFAGTPELTTLRGLSMIAVIHWNPVAFGDLSQRASSITNVERISTNVRGASAGSTVGLFQGMVLQESASGTQDFSSGLVFRST